MVKRALMVADTEVQLQLYYLFINSSDSKLILIQI